MRRRGRQGAARDAGRARQLSSPAAAPRALTPTSQPPRRRTGCTAPLEAPACRGRAVRAGSAALTAPPRVGASEVDHAVDQVEADVGVGDPQDRPGPVTGQQLGGQRRGGGVVEVAGGLVEDQHRLVGEQRPRHAQPRPLTTRQPGVAVAQPGVEPVRQRRPARAEPGAAEGVDGPRRRSRRAGPAGRSRPRWSRTRAGRRPPARCDRRTSSRARSRRSCPPCRTAPATGSRNRTSSAATVLLPDPEAPTSATRSPGSRRSEHSAVAAPRRPSARGRRPSRRRAGRTRAWPTVSRTAGAVRESRASRAAAAAVRADSAPASASGARHLGQRERQSRSSAIIGPDSVPAATAGAVTQGDASHRRRRQWRAPRLARRRPSRWRSWPPAEPVADPRHVVGAPVRRLPHPVLTRQLHHLDDAGRQVGAQRDRARSARGGAAPPDRTRRPGRRRWRRRPTTSAAAGRRSSATSCGQGDDDRVAAPRHPHPQLAVDDAVDVVHDRGQQVAAAAPEPSRGQRHDGVVHLDPAPGQQPERHVVRAQPLGVPQHGAGQAEGAHADDRHQQGEHRGLGRGLHDQPPGRRGQRDAGRGGEGGQDRARPRTCAAGRSAARVGQRCRPGSRQAARGVRRLTSCRGRRCRQLQPVVGDRRPGPAGGRRRRPRLVGRARRGCRR